MPVRYEADVAVFGSGMAGVSAAIGAAMQGASVLLVERFGILGGNSTTGGVASFCGNTLGQGKPFDLVVEGLEAFGAIAALDPGRSSRVFNHEILAVVLQELVLQRGIKVLLHTRFVDVRCRKGHIGECLVCGPSGLEAVCAKQFLDCTGEGELAQRAGFPTMKGGDSGYQLPMSLMYFVRHVAEGEQRREVPEGWFARLEREDQLPMTSIWPNGPGSNAVKIKIPMFDSTDTQSMTAAEIRGRRRMMEVLDYHQRVEGKSWIYDHCSPMIGIREGLRITGDYVLSVEDLRAGRSFEDSVAVGTFYLDGHKTDDDRRTYILPKGSLAVPPYDVPLRALIAKGGDNLMMAGRCLSADQLALSSARVTTTCSMTGHAAGITAALAAAAGTDVRSIPARKVQGILLANGAILDKGRIKEMYHARTGP
ncbi:MAG: hypothetical protein A2177_09165 [Spirochaetes bacterium RBG_13_68_11]|nr:MAG: hypothetical protein A2177_09165 [Spirochaetes bacterium RBG_13_68_11]